MTASKELSVGDIVKIIDGSWAERLDKYQKDTQIGLCNHNFKVIYVKKPKILHMNYYVIHDIHIQDLITGAIYLHSSSFVTIIESKAHQLEEIDSAIKSLQEERDKILINYF